MNKLSLLTLSALTLLSLSLPSQCKGGPPPPTVAAQVIVHPVGCDGAPAAITGDGLENDTYTDGVDGVDCHFGTSTKDLLLQLWPTSRRLNYNMSAGPVDLGPSCPVVSPAPHPIPFGFSDPSFVGIGSLLDETRFPVGSGPLPTQAWFVTHTIDNVNFAAKYNPGQGFCSLPVLVQHPDPYTWEVCAQAPNDLAVVVQSKKNQTVPVGYFSLPFHLTVKRLP